jgi:hypothetical protein
LDSNKEFAENYLRENETCYAYNSSFNFYYKHPMPRKICQKLVDRRNECKGGHWEVRRKVDYEDHFDLLEMRGFTCCGDGSVFTEEEHRENMERIEKEW